jgi:nucleoside-diphosphate-sugar epimerase
MNVFCLGFGYSAQRFATLYGEDYFIAGSVRTADKVDALRREGFQAFVFDGQSVTADCAKALRQADALIVSVPPQEQGDGHEAITQILQGHTRLKSIVYYSTIGVYGDRDGAWVTEKDPATPMQPRSVRRYEAELNWQRTGTLLGAATVTLRLAGIYGPGQNAIEQMRAGTARCIVKPGQVFNRIHVDDIARVTHAALENSRHGGVYNVTDNEPAPPQDVTVYAAKLLNKEPPPAINWQQAGLSPMGLSFYEENKRVSNALIHAEFGDDILLYPTYREGLKSFL